MLIQAGTAAEAFRHTQLTALLLMVLGWSLNWEKSSFIPSQEITHLGFVFNTKSMTVKCLAAKVTRLQNVCRTAMIAGHITVLELERMLGYMESVRPVTPMAALHYRSIQRQLIAAKSYHRRPAQVIHLSTKSLASLKWWVSPSGFASHSVAPIVEPAPTVQIWTDSNLVGGGVLTTLGENIFSDYGLNLSWMSTLTSAF